MAKLAQYLEGKLLRDILARHPYVGLAHAVHTDDVRAFGLTWIDCLSYLRQLGYTVHMRMPGHGRVCMLHIGVSKTGSS